MSLRSWTVTPAIALLSGPITFPRIAPDCAHAPGTAAAKRMKNTHDTTRR